MDKNAGETLYVLYNVCTECFSSFFYLFFSSVCFRPSSFILETILWVDGVRIVSLLGCCFANSNLPCSPISSLFLICWDNLCCVSLYAPSCVHWSYLCISWTVFLLLLLCRTLHITSTRTSVVGLPWFSLSEMVSKVRDAGLTLAGIEPETCRTAVWHSIHWATTIYDCIMDGYMSAE